MIDRIGYWIIRRMDRVKWRVSGSRELAYSELALEAAIQANAAARGGHVEDSRILLSLSEQLTRLGKSPDGKSAVSLMRAMAHS